MLVCLLCLRRCPSFPNSFDYNLVALYHTSCFYRRELLSLAVLYTKRQEICRCEHLTIAQASWRVYIWNGFRRLLWYYGIKIQKAFASLGECQIKFPKRVCVSVPPKLKLKFFLSIVIFHFCARLYVMWFV